MQLPIEQIICNLIQTYMDLPDNWGTDKNGNEIPCVVIRGQNILLFNTPQIQVTVSTLSNQIYSLHTDFADTDTGYSETVHSNEKRSMQIDIYSKNTDALMRYNEVQLALNSTLAEQLQEQYNFKIANISQAQNLSGLEGGSELNRYAIRFDVLLWHSKTTTVDYYDTFSATVQADNKNVIKLDIMNNPEVGGN
jgi:hypothetical protein